MKRFYEHLLFCFLGLSLLLTACNNNGGAGKHAPIVLGDSSTIVTEKDDQYLQDHVTDIKAPEPKPENDTPAPPPAHDTIKPTSSASTAATTTTTPTPEAEPAPVTPHEKGLEVAFSNVTISFPGISAKPASRNQNLAKANGATYLLTSGNLSGNHIVISNCSSVRVAQRYQTMLVLKDKNGILPLETFIHTTSWENLRGRGNKYDIASLSPSRLEGSDFTSASLRRAIIKAARRHRISHRSEEEWLKAVRNVRNAHHRPITVDLRSVMWKIDGKDTKGRSFSKQVRIGVPGL